ncbi:MAG: glycosyltransferase family 2 protein [Pyrinomonadaceae bacterium]
MKLSIVIIGRNEQSGIAKCVEAAQAAAREIGGAEMIFVDSHSTDRTVEIVRGFGVTVLDLSAGLRLSPSAGRYAGSQDATGEYILFLDADTLIYQGFLQRAISYIESDPRLAGVNGRIDDVSESGEFILELDERFDEPTDVKWLRGPACFYRRAALLEVGSFDPELAMEEEAELGLRLIKNGWRLSVIPHPMACHTRCYHGVSAASIVSTFMRDMRAKRLGEITKTISHAARAGNGIAFCWLRLKTTILFAAWVLMIALCTLLPSAVYPAVIAAFITAAGALALLLKKRSLRQTILFVPAKLLNLIDILSGLHKITLNGRQIKSNLQ